MIKSTRLIASLVHQRPRFSTDVFTNPSKYVVGVTPEKLAQDEELAEFMSANFSHTTELTNESDNKPVDESETSPPEATKSVVDEASPLNIRKLHCLLRDPDTEEGSRACRRLRQNRMIPGILYGRDPTQGISSTDPSSKILVKTPWRLLHRELDLYYRTVENRVYDLTVYENQEDEEGVLHRVIPTGVRWHPVKSSLFCADYLRYFPGRPIDIPIVYINEEESATMKRGGFIAPISRHVNCIVEDGVPIPTSLELDCTGMQLKEVVRMDRIIFPEGVTPSKRVNVDNFLVGTLFGSRGAPLEGETEEEL